MTATIKPNMEYRGFEITTVKYVEERHPQYNYLSFMARNGDKHIEAVFRDLDMRIKSEDELLSIFKNRIDSFIEEMDIIRKQAMLTKKDLDEYTKSDPKGEGFDDQEEMSGTLVRRTEETEEERADRFENCYMPGLSYKELKKSTYDTLNAMEKNGYHFLRLKTELGYAEFRLLDGDNKMPALICDLRS